MGTPACRTDNLVGAWPAIETLRTLPALIYYLKARKGCTAREADRLLWANRGRGSPATNEYGRYGDGPAVFAYWAEEPVKPMRMGISC